MKAQPETITCFKCKQTLPASSFYKRCTLCKPCHIIRDRNRADRSGPQYSQRESTRARKRKYAATYHQPYKSAARGAATRAIASGKLIRKENCEECGSSKRMVDGRRGVHAHHDDYSKPLDVRWLCVKCHMAWHRNNTALQPGQGT